MIEKQLEQVSALIKQGRKKQAIQLLKTIIRENPNNVKALWMLANLLDKPEHQEKVIEKLLAIEPEHAEAIKLRASMQIEDAIDESATKATIDHDWSKLEKRKPRKANKEKDSHIIHRASVISSRIIIGTLALLALWSLFVFLNPSAELQMERATERYFLAYFENRYEDANKFICRENHMSAEEIAVASNTQNPTRGIHYDTSGVGLAGFEINGNWASALLTGKVTITNRNVDPAHIEHRQYRYPDQLQKNPVAGFRYEDGKWRYCPVQW